MKTLKPAAPRGISRVAALLSYIPKFNRRRRYSGEPGGQRLSALRDDCQPALRGKLLATIAAVVFASLSAQGQTLLDSFSDGNLTANPTWSGDTANWTIVANSDAAAGATASQTLRLSAPAVAQTEHLSTPVADWGDSQEWGIWVGIRAQALTAANKRYVWLYASEADLESATVDGYRLSIGDDSGNDEIRLERIVDGAVGATVLSSTGAIANGLTDIGFLMRVTRNGSGLWTLYTSTLPTANGAGAIATDVPSSANAAVNQGSATDNVLPLTANGYFGVAVLHSTGANAIVGTEFDQIYFTSTPACTPPASQAVLGTTAICAGDSAVVNLDGSETGVTYSLKDGSTVVSTAAGTGSGIGFAAVSPVSTTFYTVVATNDTTLCGASMAGSATVTVDSPVTPSVSISASPGTTTCAGNQVIFTVTPINGGALPGFVWKTNGVPDTSVPGNSATYTNSNLANGDTIDCQMTSALTCVTVSTADAPQLTMTITASVIPSVNVTVNPGTTICAGSPVRFTAVPVNGGSSPVFVWKTNGVQDASVPASSATYTNSSLANGDTIDCQLISNDPCASPSSADSIQITMTVNAVVTPSVRISAAPGSPICLNSSVTFTATPVNGGAAPAYQWKTNATAVPGATGSTFVTTSLKNGDVVTVVMTPSSEICVSSAVVTSDGITMTVNPVPNSTIAAAASVVQNSSGNTASVSDAGVGASYAWTISNGTITAGDGTATITYSAGSTLGTLALGCTVTTSAGCSSIGSANVVVHAPLLAGWDVSTQPGGANNFGVSPLSASTADANLTIGGLTRGSGVSTNGTGAARGWGGTDWQSTSAANAVTSNKFVTFTVTPQAGFKVSFNSISKFDYRRSGTGATSGTIQYQVGGADAFHDITTVAYTSSSASGAALSPVDLSGIAALQDVAADTVVTFRIVNFGGTSSAGTWYIFDMASNTAPDFEISGYVACVAPTATLSGDSTICAGSSGNLTTALTGVPPWSVTWSDGVTSNNVASSPLSRTVSPGATMTYTLTSVSDSGGCGAGTVSGSATITVNPLPTVSVNSATICAGGSANLTATTDASNPSYLWNPGGETTASITVSPGATTIYSVTVTDGTTACANSGSGTITVNPLPTVAIEPAVTNSECGGTILLTASPAGDGPLIYQWYDPQTNAIAGETNLTLTLTNVHDAAAGNYAIVVIGQFCTASAVASVTVADTTTPIITLLGADPVTNECHIPYLDAGAIASDACVGVLNVSTNNTVDASLPGVYTVSYVADDGNGNTNLATRTVYVVDTVGPVLTVLGENPATNECHFAFVDAGAKASDACAGSVSVSTNSLVNTEVPGIYAITYTSDDGNGNTNTATRTVYVVDTLSPTLTIWGANPTTNECHVPYVDAGATASDVCAGSVGVSTNISVDANVPGVYTVVYTADDGNGNTNNATRIVYVTDTAGPVIAVLGDNPATNECHVPYLDAGATASDACVGSVVLSTSSTVDENMPGVYSVTYTSDDGNGNTNVVTRTVHVVDTTPPVIACATNKTVDCGSAWVFDEPTASDGCSGNNVLVAVLGTTTNGNVFTRSWAASDPAGNTNTCSQSVTMLDSTPPVVTYYFTNLIFSADGSCQALMPDVTGTNFIQAEDACSAVTITQMPTNNAPIDLGTNDVVLTVADGAGNAVYSTNTIVVVDATGPVVTILGDNPLTVECHGSFADPGASANDNCSGIAAVITNGIVNADVPGSYTIEYRATDAAGNSVTNARLVNVVDTLGPIITLDGTNPEVVECHSSFSDPGATATDACAGAVVVVVSGSVNANAPGSYTLTYTAHDGNGNTNNVTRTVNVVDTISPVIAFLGDNPATNQCHVAYVDAGATASDGCAGDVSVSTHTVVDANVPGIYAVTYTADDGNGNTNTSTRTVYVVDTVAPVVTVLGANPATNECHVPYADVGATANDSCAGLVSVSTNSMVNPDVPGVYTVTYTADDGNGNTNVASRMVYITDTVGPVIAILGDNPATNECHVAYVDAGAMASDNCAGVVGLATNGTVDADVPGVYAVTYTSDDGNGNTNAATRTVAVVDTVAPALAILGANPVTNQCHVPYLDAGATASDACAGAVLVLTNSTVDGNVPGVYTVTYKADDGNGNTNTATRTVYVIDTVGPVIAILGANPATNECHAAYADAGATASDACAGDLTVATSGGVDANVPGVYSVTYAADDGNGNTNTATRTVYVVDTVGPVLVCGTNKFVECGGLWSFDEPAAVDDCAGTNVTVVIVETVTNGNTFTRTWAASDPIGNTNTFSQSVTVGDTLPPVIAQCPTNRTMVVGNNCVVTLPDFTGELMASDSCSSVAVTQNPAPGTEVGVGALLVSFTVTDVVSNSSVCSLVLNVTTPDSANTNISISEFMAKNTMVITDDFGAYSDWIEIHNAGSCPLNLDGWSLTDDVATPTKWRFPATNIGPGQFLVVWASDRNVRTPGAPLHTNFKLADQGEYLALVQPDGVTVATQFYPTFPPQWPDVSYGMPTDATTNNFLASPTPGSANSVGTNFIVSVIISEFMAKNTLGPVDNFGAHSDWIEIFNGGCCPVNLNGWSLTDDAMSLTKWRFPATNIGPGEFLVVWASDRNLRTPGAPLHTNFKLGDEGEYLALVQPDGVTIASQFSPTFPPQFPDVSYGLPSGGTTNGYLASATPGSLNSAGTNFLVADLEFSPGRGWYTNVVTVSIGTPTSGVTIYYTTDGSIPGPTNGLVYAGPLIFSNTTVLRAGAYRPAFLPSIMTHTYVFPTEVANQTGAGFPTNWGFTSLGAVPAYYTCNTNLVNDPRWGGRMPAALMSLPTLSVVMDPEDMFGTNGLYANTFGEGVEWERACSIEYFRPDAKPGFQINAGVRIHGQGSRNPEYTPKHNLRVYFRQAYGAAKLTYELYAGSPVQEFDVLVLHASLTDHWYVIGRSAQEQRNQWCADTQNEIGDFGTHGTYVNLYINGLYWGMYNLGERPDASYAAKFLGGNKSDYDAFNGIELMDGTTNAWNELMTLVDAGITNDIAWSNACYYLDVPSLINYLLINFYAVNTEEFDHNWWLVGNVAHGVPFRFFSWDAEDGFEAYGPETTPITYNILGLAEACPTWLCRLHSSLGQHPEYVRLFGDQAQRLLFNHGALTPERSSARWMKRAREIDKGIISESVRWGITNWWGVMPFAEWILYTHDDWLAQQNYLMTNWFPRRTDMLIGQLRDAALYPALDAPIFAPHGGIISGTLPVTITTPPGATLYYSTSGNDPRMSDGAVSPQALVYNESVPLMMLLTNDTHLSARAFVANTWSALVEADYLRASEVELRITAIARLDDGDAKLDFLAWPGAAYTLKASTNLHDWDAISPVIPFPDGTANYVDTTVTNYPVRFYKLTWP